MVLAARSVELIGAIQNIEEPEEFLGKVAEPLQAPLPAAPSRTNKIKTARLQPGVQLPEPRRPRPLREQALAYIAAMREGFELHYAPRAWKEQALMWDLHKAADAAAAELRAMKRVTVKDIQRVLRQFSASTRDYHVQSHFFSTEKASLPFLAQSAEDRFFVAVVDQTKDKSQLSVGDEIVAFNDKPILQAIRELEAALGRGSQKTDRALAALALTARDGAQGLEVPQGRVTLTVRKKGGGQLVNVQLDWDYHPEKITSEALERGVAKKSSAAKLAQSAETLPAAELKRIRALLVRDDLRAEHIQAARAGFTPDAPMLSPLFPLAPKSDTHAYEVGSRESLLPALGKVLWQAPPMVRLPANDGSLTEMPFPFKAYIYADEAGRRIGFLRIPTYNPEIPALNAMIFGALLEQFTKQGVQALVLDQMNNPGGDVLYLYALLSKLGTVPLRTPKHAMSISQAEVAQALAALPVLKAITTDAQAIGLLGATLNGYPVSKKLVDARVRFSEFIIKEWQAGRTITQPFPLYGIDVVDMSKDEPFNKPILLLANELDFSGGDFFPAILQDNRRATVMGARTAGAGGYVRSLELPNLLGVRSFSFTGSIAVRQNGSPIENLGVEPEIGYAVSADDVQNGYRGFAAALNKQLATMLAKKPVQE